MSSIDGSDGDMPAPAAVGAKRGRPSRSLAIRTLGPVLAFAVYSSTLPGALWQNVFEGENLDGYQEPGIPKYFCGVVLAQCKLEATPITDENPTFRLMRKASLKGSRRCHELVGFATWHIIEVLAGDGAQPDGFFPSPEWLSSNVADRMNSDGEVEERDMPFSHFLDIWRSTYKLARTVSPISFDVNLVSLFFAEGFRILHTVPLFRNRQLFRRRIINGAPSFQMLRRWITSQPRAAAGSGDGAHGRASTESRWGGALKVDHVLAWLDAAKFVKHGHQIGQARKAFQSLEMTLRNDLTNHYTGSPYSATSIRKARVNLDATCMRLFREFWKTLNIETVWIHIHIDASPQWKGLELFSGSFDMIVHNVEYFCQHRFFPQIRIGPYLFSVRGKTFALLWMIWLMVGPTYEAVKDYCCRTRFINSDFGTEHKIVDMPDVLIDFFNAIGVHVPATAVRGLYLFPHGLLLPGWHHLFDGIIRWGLCTLVWFGGFLMTLKAWVKLCRNHGDDLVKEFRRHGLDAAASMFKKLSFPTFAQWRWRKLAAVCRGIARARLIVLGAPCINVFKAFVAKLADNNMTKAVIRSVGNTLFDMQFNFVNWYADKFTAMEAWGSSCPKHQQEWKDGNPCQCIERGRLIPYAWDYSVEKFAEIRMDTDEWTATQWGSHGFLSELRGCVLATIDRGTAKLEPYNKIPILFGKIGYEDGIVPLCTHQYNTLTNHNRVSHEFMRPGTYLNNAIVNMQHPRDLSDPFLKSAVHSIRDGNLDDSWNEFPHAQFSRIHVHSPSSVFAWKASTLRLDQNLTDAQDLPSVCGHDLQTLWDGFKQVLQKRRRNRDPKISRAAFLDGLYTLTSHFGGEANEDERNYQYI